MEFDFDVIEEEIKQLWAGKNVFRTESDPGKQKYYIMDMFPYPSGAGLHVGHPLGYIGSDIIARYKRLKGFNVLHPMGYDSFGLPAEQYAIQTGQHPAVTTEENIRTFRQQMDKLGFSFDWSREIRTSDPRFYRWTQWIFIKFFHCWYNNKLDKAEPIEILIQEFTRNGNLDIKASSSETKKFSADDWKKFSAKEQSDILLNYRLAYLADSWVNWCPALGTVLANDEVKDGVSERGGYPVERKLMKQWSMRITAYAERLLSGLEKIDWSDSLKESQRNWIGKSEGCSVQFKIDHRSENVEVFTTRPDTIFGATFITLAPEHELVNKITIDEYKREVENYVAYAKNRTERERMADVKKITGQFTGAHAVHPFTQDLVPIWIGEYVLAGYGTGAVMSVPGHDERDHRFAKHFGLPIISILKDVDVSEESFDEKEGLVANSGFLNGLHVKQAISKAIDEIEKLGIGKRKVNYKLHDAVFGRQRYWGEPIPVYYDEQNIPHTIDEKDLPLVLPEIDKYLPTETGEPPLARAANWKYKGQYDYELTTMPGWAGSSWYYLRYEDPYNDQEFASRDAISYWQNVDFYLGGDEHATGHLLYFRFWTKFLFDIGLIPFDEPAKKLLNQGKIQGVSSLMYRVRIPQRTPDNGSEIFVSKGIIDRLQNKEISEADLTELIKKSAKTETTSGEFTPLSKEQGSSIIISTRHIYIGWVNNHILNVEQFRKASEENAKAILLTEENGDFICDSEVEKMSKSKYNVINPDDVVSEYGADAFRMYEMFLGPIEQHKPWDTKGIDGVYRFLKKLWRLFYDEKGTWLVSDEIPTNEELKALHRTIKKAQDDVERLSFNTSVSAFMILVNELTQFSSSKRKILEPFLVILSPYAPFVTEFLWQKLGHTDTIIFEKFPEYDESLLVENAFEYPVAVNGKTRVKINLALDLSNEQIEKEVLQYDALRKYLDGKSPKKVIIVKGRMINVVV